MSSNLYFLKGQNNLLENQETDQDAIAIIKDELLKVVDVKNLSFLLGAGCSSFIKDGSEIGIAVMKVLAKNFFSSQILETESKFVKEKVGIDIKDKKYGENLERFLEVLYSYKFLIESRKENTDEINNLIKKVTTFLTKSCINEDNNKNFSDVTDLYSLFYKKLVYRDSNLAKINIFTTNYDLYTESALDRLGILYTNGFSGFIERYFNPAVFNYAFAEQMELSNSKWNVIDNFIYLYKLHGSVSWIVSNNTSHLFGVKETQSVGLDDNNYMIYPTPIKQVASFGSPYSDLFREFQKKLMQDKNVLISIGYSFSDEHINNIIYQALTIPNFRLIIFADKEIESIENLATLNDPRIWIIGGTDSENKKIHYFDYIVKKLLPEIDQEKIEASVDEVIKKLIKSK